MGLFGSKKIIQVASTVYNMAGDYDPKKTYMKSVIFSAVMNNTDIGDGIRRSLLSGPYQGKRKYFNWSTKYNYDGNLITNINRQKEINLDDIYGYIDTPSDQFLYIQKALLERADVTYFAEKYLLENDPSKRYEVWTADLIGPLTGEITYPDNSTDIFSLPVEFSPYADYLVIYYSFFKEAYNEDLVEGAIIVSNDLPDTSDYIIDDTESTIEAVVLNKHTHILRQYSNGDVDIEENYNDPFSVDFENIHTSKYKITYLGNTGGETISNRTDYYNEWLNYSIESDTPPSTVEIIDHGTYTETVTTTITTEYLEDKYSYKEDYQISHNNEKISDNMIIYKLGSGEEILDDLIDSSTEITNEFYPIIPLRIKNVSIKDLDEIDYPNAYTDSVKAYKKLADNAKLDSILDTIEDNENVGDIDYAYIYLGVPLNTKSQKELKYIYRFLKNLIPYQTYDKDTYLAWLNKAKDNDTYDDFYKAWLEAQSDPDNPLYNTPKPINGENQGLNAFTPNINKLDLRTNGELSDNFNMVISWFNIEEEIEFGLGKPDAKIGEYWWEYPDDSPSDYKAWWQRYLSGSSDTEYGDKLGIDKLDVTLFFQLDSDTHTKLIISGLEHRNYIYGNHNVQHTAFEALTDEEPSGFIIPLHTPTLKTMSMADRNEVVLYSHQIVFNCVVIKKTKWYQSKAFAWVITITLITITIATFGTLGPATTIGLASASISSVIYLASLYGIDLSFLNYLSVQGLLQAGLELFLDERTAQIIVLIATIVLTQDFSQSFEMIATDLVTNIDILMKFTGVVLAFQAEDNSDLINEVQALQTQFTTISKQIESNNETLNLTENNDIVTNTIKNVLLNFNENPEQFLNRTLASSENFINASLNFISNYSNIMLDLETLKRS